MIEQEESGISLSVADLGVIVDTLNGSLSLADRRDLPLFSYTRETREALSNRLLSAMGDMQIEIRLREQS